MGDLMIQDRRDEETQALVVEIAGFLDSHTVSKLERTLQGYIAAGSVRIIVDFSKLEYISSAGIGVFMSVIGTIRSRKGDVVLAAMNPKILKIFTLLGINQIFRIVDTVPEALAHFE